MFLLALYIFIYKNKNLCICFCFSKKLCKFAYRHKKEEEENQMDEKAEGVSHSKARGNGPTKKRFSTMEDCEGDMVECSSKYFKSCTTGLITDCVALCCCPCVVLHCFALAFIKAPWVMGRKCLGLGKNKNHQKGHHKKNEDNNNNVVLQGNNKEDDLKGGCPTSTMEGVNSNLGFEADKVWHDLYQIGHLDFGRVSLSED